MSGLLDDIKAMAQLREAQGGKWSAIKPEYAARMRAQNRFHTGLDIARYTAKIMRDDMAAYDADTSQYTQSLGCWHGFIGQQKLISIKKHFGTTKRRYLYLSGWMVAALRSEFGPLPDQSMHEKTSVANLIEELYTFLKQADAWELNHLFRALDDAKAAGDSAKEKELISKIDNYETHIVPIIADIHFHYKRALEAADAGAACLRINPGNIGSSERVAEVVRAAKANGCAIRIGVNAGSLEKDLLEKYGEPCPEALVESALDHIRLLEEHDFREYKVAVKASDVFLAVAAYQALGETVDCPLHLGITEAGGLIGGTVKSSIGIGSLLYGLLQLQKKIRRTGTIER
mgnify:CR=1 FL=1